MGEEEKIVLSIKLGALEEEVMTVKGKIQQVLAKKHIKESGAKRI